MSVFDNILGNWIQIVDDNNTITIESYRFDTGVIEGTTDNHCIKCVAANKCWFKNEDGKKPDKFNYSKINTVDAILKGLIPGLYHFKCHCKEEPINVFSDDNIQLIIPEGKIGWLFKDKSEWISSMGYELDDKFLNTLYQRIKQAYFYGNYFIQSHTNYGVKIKINFDLPGQGSKTGKVYKLTSSFTVFPNGKIKCNTLIGGWQK